MKTNNFIKFIALSTGLSFFGCALADNNSQYCGTKDGVSFVVQSNDFGKNLSYSFDHGPKKKSRDFGLINITPTETGVEQKITLYPGKADNNKQNDEGSWTLKTKVVEHDSEDQVAMIMCESTTGLANCDEPSIPSEFTPCSDVVVTSANYIGLGFDD